MSDKRRAVIAISLLSALAILLVLEFQTRMIRRTFDDVIYDNRFHHISCEKLPPITEVDKVVNEHQDVIRKIERVNPGFVGVDVNTCGAENADITFWYGSHQDRIAIEEVIGSDTFFGIPYNLHNR
jgi:hypothetical protein